MSLCLSYLGMASLSCDPLDIKLMPFWYWNDSFYEQRKLLLWYLHYHNVCSRVRFIFSGMHSLNIMTDPIIYYPFYFPKTLQPSFYNHTFLKRESQLQSWSSVPNVFLPHGPSPLLWTTSVTSEFSEPPLPCLIWPQPIVLSHLSTCLEDSCSPPSLLT